MKFIFLLITFLISNLLISSCRPVPNHEFLAKKGVLHLENWDYSNPINLKGEWEFFWKNLILEKKDTNNSSLPYYANLPFVWNETIYKNETLSGEGYASFKLNILLNNNFPDLYIYMQDQGTNYSVYVNGKYLGGDNFYYEGGSHKSIPIEPSFHPKKFKLPHFENETSLEVVLYISNYLHDKGGPWYPIYLGTEESIREQGNNRRANDFFFSGAIVIIGIYHLIIFINRLHDRSSILFFIICFITSVRILLTADRFLFDYINLEGVIVYRIEYLSFYLLPPLYSYFVHVLFPKEYNYKASLAIISFFAIQIFLVIFFPLNIFSKGLQISELLTVFALLHGIFALFNSVKQKREGAKLFLTGYLFLCIIFINDILHSISLITTFYALPFGMIGFILLQSFILSLRYSASFRKAEEHYKALQISHTALKDLKISLENLVLERTKELGNTLRNINKDLIIAQKIQNKILPKYEQELTHIRCVAEYIPMELVGGDFFDIAEINEKYIRFFLADATGHGIQAAMITMVIKSEYEGLKLIIQRPEMLLELLNREIHRKFKDLKIYFSCAIVDIDIRNKKIIYSSAGHPSQILIKNNSIINLSNKGKIIGFQEEQEITFMETDIDSGDRIYLFTDGLFEQFNDQKEEFGEKRLQEILLLNSHLSLKKSTEKLLISLSKFLGSKVAGDDITLLAVEIK
jgi:sigma-B regulation protein RsbU (phosphoserine phosphatase)